MLWPSNLHKASRVLYRASSRCADIQILTDLGVALAAAGSKKISSEEETYSDLSILIFYHNFKGIESQYAPFAPLVRAANASAAQASKPSSQELLPQENVDCDLHHTSLLLGFCWCYWAGQLRSCFLAVSVEIYSYQAVKAQRARQR